MTPSVPKGAASLLEKNCKSLFRGSTQTSVVRVQLCFSYTLLLAADFIRLFQGLQVYSVLTDFRKRIDTRNITESLRETCCLAQVCMNQVC